jgi:hypothetical protein
MRTQPKRQGVTPGLQQPRFPGFDVLAQTHMWDEVTLGVVLARLGPLPPLRFFNPQHESVARPLLNLILDQYDEPRVPVFEMIDQRLAELSTDGWRYEDLPADPQAWATSLEALNQDAQSEHQRDFGDLDHDAQAQMLQGMLDLGGEKWHGMRADRVWSLWSRYACTAFYSHPWAWNEIGWPGPAYPRGYKNLGVDSLEPFEVVDHQPIDPQVDR